MGEPSRRRVTYGQLEQLWEFLNKRRDIAMGYNKTSQAREFSRRMWEEIALTLNSHGDGAVKDWKGWCKYWNDFKSKLKKLAALSKMSQNMTGGGQSINRPMTDIEKKFLHILGQDFGIGLPGIRVEPFEETVQNQINIPERATATDPSHSGCSESLLPRMQEYENQPGPSWRVSPNASILICPMTPPQIPSTPSRTPRPTPRRICRSLEPTAFTPRRSPRRRLFAPAHTSSCTLLPSTTPTHTQHAPTTPHAPAPSSPRFQCEPQAQQTELAPVVERRRQTRREPPLTAERARRILISESQKVTKIQQEKLKTLICLVEELRSIKEILQERH